MKGRKYSFIKNLTTIFIGSIATKLVSFLLVPLYTAVLSTEEYGSVDIAITTASLLLPFFTGVIFEAILRFSLDETQNKKEVFSIAIFVDIIGVVVFLLLSPLVFFYKPLSSYYIYFILYFIALVFNDTVLYFARGLNEIRKYTIASVVQTLLLCTFNILFLVVFRYGIEGYFLSYILSSVLSTVILWLILHMGKYLVFPSAINKKTIKEMLKYSVPMIPNTISWWVNSSSDKYFIIAMCDTASNGIYAVAAKIPTVISLGTSIFNTAWQITAIEDYSTNESRKRYSKMCFDYYSIVFLMGTVVVALTRFLSSILFKQGFFEAWIYVPMLTVAACFHSFSTFIGSVFTTTKKTKYLSYTTIAGAVLNIIMNYLFIRFWGTIGAAIATVISYIFVYALRFYFSQKIYYFKIEIVNDLVCFVLLLIEMIAVCMNFAYVYLLSLVVVLAVMVLRKKTYFEMIYRAKGIVKKVLKEKGGL